MTESTLSTTFSEIKVAVAHFLGIGTTEADWSANDATIIDMIVKRGLRQFYFPPTGYQWSFLKPVCEMDTIATYDTGTVAVVSGICTLTTGTWPSWAATHGTLTIGTTVYAITTRDSDSQLTVVGIDVAALTEYTLEHDGNYDLPDDFGGLEGDIVNETTTLYPALTIVGEGRIRSERRNNTARTYPLYAAVRPKEHTETTAGQRFEIMFFPIPDAVYTLSYVKRILPQMLVDTTLTYPYGGTSHAETILASCLAVAEEQENDASGVKRTLFNERLEASFASDRQFNNVDFYGYNGNGSRDDERPYRPCKITYKGETY